MIRLSRLRSLQMACVAGFALLLSAGAAKAQVVNLTFYFYTATAVPTLPGFSVTPTGTCQQVPTAATVPGLSVFSVNITGPIATDAAGEFKVGCGFNISNAKTSLVLSNLVFDPKTSKVYADAKASDGVLATRVEILDGYTGTYAVGGVNYAYALLYLNPNIVSQLRSVYGIDAMYAFASAIATL